MKKSLIALAVLGVAAGVAHAEPNVSVYGVVDTGYIKESGKDLRMGENVNSRIGFRGAEDLGGGLKAIFQLEKRFNVHNGTNNSGDTYDTDKDWEGAANVGLASDAWGKIRFGRVNELTTETIRKFDPFYQYGIGGMIESTQRSARIDNTARYDSPKWNGFSFGLSYSLGRDSSNNSDYQNKKQNWDPQQDGAWVDYDNDGYGINLSYDNGPFMATANWSRVADSADSSVWNIGVAYKFGTARISLLYEKTKDKGFLGGSRSANDPAYNAYRDYDAGNYGVWKDAPIKSEQEVWLLGLEWDIGPGQLDASIQRGSMDDIKAVAGQVDYAVAKNQKLAKDGDVMKYAIGYTYNLSKRTSVYGQVSYTDSDKEVVGWAADRESVTGVQVGMTHKF